MNYTELREQYKVELKKGGTYENRRDRHRRDYERQHKRDAVNSNGTFNTLLDDRRYELPRAYGDLLREVDKKVDFKWYATLTFASPVHPESAIKRYKRWTHQINREVYGVRYTKRKQGVRWVRALELQKRGVIHFHCLIADIPAQWNSAKKDFRRLHWMDKWSENNGYARIYEYDKKLGACYYLGKYISKGGEIDYSFNIANAMHKQLEL